MSDHSTPAEILLQAALAYARSGLPVLPLQTVLAFGTGRYVCGCGTLRCGSPGKHPLPRYAPKGLRNATTVEHIVRHWWTCVPHANIGIRTGTVIVLDVDPRHGGDQALSQ